MIVVAASGRRRGVTVGSPTGGSGGPLTDRTSVSYNNGTKTSTYHIYAAGLDWTRQVGLLVYGDGSGEAGLVTPSSTYLLAGTDGLIAVAKRNNMLLVTPRAPGNGCTDGDGVCWYLGSGDGTTRAQKTTWLDNLIKTQILPLYNIDKTRVCIAGFSSGAENAAGIYGPAFAASWMEDGLLLAISYGSSPAQYGITNTYTAAFRSKVAVVWDVRGGDETTAVADSLEGYNWYAGNGFTTLERNVIPGGQHDRPGEFGAIVEQYLTEYIPAGAALPTRTAWLWPFATSSFWNMPIGDGATYETASDVATANLLDPTFGSTLNGDRWSHPVYRASASDPIVTVSEVDSSPRTITFQAISNAAPSEPPLSESGDCNLHMCQPDGQFLYENWRAEWTSATTMNVGYNVRVDLFGDGRTGARAYGGAAIGGLIRRHEVANRNIPHGISIALDSDQLKSGPVWPARLQDSNGATTYAGQIPMGSLVAIPRTVNLATLGLNADALALATALQLYGGYITARAGNVVAIYAEPGSDATRVSAMRSQWATVRAQLRLVTNNSQTTPGGPGSRLAPLAPTVVG